MAITSDTRIIAFAAVNRKKKSGRFSSAALCKNFFSLCKLALCNFCQGLEIIRAVNRDISQYLAVDIHISQL